MTVINAYVCRFDNTPATGVLVFDVVLCIYLFTAIIIVVIVAVLPQTDTHFHITSIKLFYTHSRITYADQIMQIAEACASPSSECLMKRWQRCSAVCRASLVMHHQLQAIPFRQFNRGVWVECDRAECTFHWNRCATQDWCVQAKQNKDITHHIFSINNIRQQPGISLSL